jgi:hypothetical protein
MIESVKQNIVNSLGWRTKRKIVVIQSDDWGSIRMPNKKTYNELINSGINVNDAYNSYDNLESNLELNNLFQVLQIQKDYMGNYPIFTANCIMANPDFNKILNNNFSEYFFEPIKDKIVDNQNLVEVWKKGLNLNVFYPQFHGREHLNISLWLKALQSKEKDITHAFNASCYGITAKTPSIKRSHYLAAFDFDNKEELNLHEQIIIDGMRLFKESLGYNSESFIAPNYVWSSNLNYLLKDLGIKYIQTQRNQLEPIHNNTKYKTIFHYTGQRSREELIFINRNCLFEPSSNKDRDWVNSCINDISLSFFWKKPAVISSHRLNFISSIDKENGDRNLDSLSELIKKILLKWPDVEFMSTNSLGEIMEL